MNLRASKLPLAFACPGSFRPAEGETLIEFAHEGAALGSAVHAVLAELVVNPNGEAPDVRPFAMKYGVDPDELGRLVSYGAHAWRAVAPYYPNPLTEQHLTYAAPAFTLSGHLDVVSLGDGWANFADWKSGYRQPDYYHQLMAYATLLFSNFPGIAEVRATVVWLRDWSQETTLITGEDVLAWEESLAQTVVHWTGTYTAGAHCQYCPRFASCPARQALVRSAVAELQPELIGPLAIDPLPAIVQMYRDGKLAIVKGLLKQIDDLIHQTIEVRGPIDLGNGRELALIGENRDTIDPMKAWPIISEKLTNEELAPAIRISKMALLDAVADKTPKGKAKAKDALMEALKAAGAVKTDTIYKLRERRELLCKS